MLYKLPEYIAHSHTSNKAGCSENPKDTFTIYENKLKEICNNNYAKHFTETLENFREDYISWFKEERYKDCEWKWEYKREFGNYIWE